MNFSKGFLTKNNFANIVGKCSDRYTQRICKESLGKRGCLFTINTKFQNPGNSW